MAANSRFAVAIHTMGVLAFVNDGPVSSEMIAKSVDTNPVVIRRIIRRFVKHGLVSVRMGTGGGASLTKPAADISLAEIYGALEENPIFQVPKLASDHPCSVGRIVRPVMEELFADVESELISRLNVISLEDVMERVSKGILEDSWPSKSE